MGMIYKRGSVWWVKYYRDGKPYYESSQSSKESQAQKLLARREGEIAKGELPGIYYDKIRFGTLADDYLTDYRINQRRSTDKAERHVRYLKEFFGNARITSITTDRVKKYIETRLDAGKSNATINRELSALKRIFSLGKRARKVNEIPYIPMLRESNTRKGFFEYEQYLALRDALPHYLQPVATVAYHTGWRKQELLKLTWDRVDLRQGIMRLDPGETKNEEGRTLYMNEDLAETVKALHGKRRLGCPYVFHHNGKPIKKFEKAWHTACRDVGLQGMLFHDFRRTAVRNMVRAGIPERVAMKMSGHKTRSIFDRYNIVSDQDLREAAQRQQAFMESQTDPGTVTKRLQSQKVLPLSH
jgi:integrase